MPIGWGEHAVFLAVWGLGLLRDNSTLWFQTPGLSKKRVRASLSDLSSLDDVEGMSVRQLKEILARNFVNYSGCCEKWELVERVNRLYKENEENQKSCRFTFFFSSVVSFLKLLKTGLFLSQGKFIFWENYILLLWICYVQLVIDLLSSKFLMGVFTLRPPVSLLVLGDSHPPLPSELGNHLFSLLFLGIIC